MALLLKHIGGRDFYLDEESTHENNLITNLAAMGWVWIDDSSAPVTNNNRTDQPLGDSTADDNCSTSKVRRSQCKTEEVEPGKFVRKCDTIEEVIRHCLGRPSEVVESFKDHTEEDITNQMVGRSPPPNLFEENHPLNLPGLRSDLDAIERHFLGGMWNFFNAAEEMSNSFFDIVGDHHTSIRRGIPIEDHPKVEDYRNDQNSTRRSGGIDLSELAKDV